MNDWLNAVMTMFAEWFNIWDATALFPHARMQVLRFRGEKYISYLGRKDFF